MTTLADCTATELLDLFAAGRATPTEAVESSLRRIREQQASLNTTILALEEQARAAARESEQRWRSGTNLPLEGVPYGLKDIVATAGVTTTGGSRLYKDNVPTEDAVLAGRLAAAGGVLIAKLGTYEFAAGGPVNRTFGVTKNPWDVTRLPGGSSSGSAAAVAARQVPFAIGTDTAGSIRIPAAYCALSAIKPTFGRVPRHGVMSVSWTLDHAGPLTRSAMDAALVLGVMAGRDVRDPSSSRRPVPAYTAQLDRSIKGLKVGRPRGLFEAGMTEASSAVFDAALDTLKELGVTIVDIELPDVDLWVTAAMQVLYSEVMSNHYEHVDGVEERDSMFADFLDAAPYVHAADYLKTLRYRRVAQDILEQAMEGLDALIAPTAYTIAPTLEEVSSPEAVSTWVGGMIPIHVPFNFTGNPAATAPTGFIQGLPVGVQIVGRPHDDVLTLRIAHHYQEATDHHLQSPPVATQIQEHGEVGLENA